MYIPIIGFANLISGLILITPWLEKNGLAKTFIHKTKAVVEDYRKTLAIIDIALGLIGLANRIGIIYISFWTGGFPQAIVVLLVGLALGGERLKGIPVVYDLAKKVEKYEPYVGVAGILFGLHAIF